jgi:hypothetical protein
VKAGWSQGKEKQAIFTKPGLRPIVVPQHNGGRPYSSFMSA